MRNTLFIPIVFAVLLIFLSSTAASNNAAGGDAGLAFTCNESRMNLSTSSTSFLLTVGYKGVTGEGIVSKPFPPTSNHITQTSVDLDELKKYLDSQGVKTPDIKKLLLDLDPGGTSGGKSTLRIIEGGLPGVINPVF